MSKDKNEAPYQFEAMRLANELAHQQIHGQSHAAERWIAERGSGRLEKLSESNGNIS